MYARTYTHERTNKQGQRMRHTEMQRQISNGTPKNAVSTSHAYAPRIQRHEMPYVCKNGKKRGWEGREEAARTRLVKYAPADMGIGALATNTILRVVRKTVPLDSTLALPEGVSLRKRAHTII